jgi:energy-coupling factor transporter ATP-binding protein EcfA2
MNGARQYTELRRIGDRFVSIPDGEIPEDETFDEEWYNDYIAKFCRKERHTIEMRGIEFNEDIFISNDDDNVAFIVEQKSHEGRYEFEQRHITYLQNHLQRYSRSETFFEPYQLTVAKQFIRTPVLKTVRLKSFSFFDKTIEESVPPEEILESQYAFIVGSPGSGKTTLIRHLAQSMTEGDSELQELWTFPIIIALRHFTYDRFNVDSLHQYLRAMEGDDLAGLICENVKDGAFRFFLDGLDEISSDRRQVIYKDIQQFAKDYSNNSITVTARDALLDEIRGPADIYRVRDWDEFQINRWCYENMQTRSSWKVFYSLVSQHPDSKKVFRNPLMLNMAAYLFDKYNMLPSRSVDLFYNIINTVIDDWDKIRGIKRGEGLWNSPRQKLTVLAYLAYELFRSNSDVLDEEIAQSWLNKFSNLAADDVFKNLALETGLLTSAGPRKWTFVHRVIQEYLAAVFVSDSSEEPLKVLTELNSERRIRCLAYLSNMISDNENFIDRIINATSLRENEKAEIMFRAIAEGMEVNISNKQDIYSLLVPYIEDKFSVVEEFAVEDNKLTIRTDSSASQGATSEVIFRLSLVGKTRFGRDFADIIRTVLPKSLSSLVRFVLESSALFIATVGSKIIEGTNQDNADFDRK